MSTEIIQIATQFTLYTGYIASSLGIIGNALNIIVFTQLKLFRYNRCAFYLIVESISSFLYQFVPISVATLTSMYGDDATGRSRFWCKFKYISTQTFALITYYMVGFAAVDQFFSTNYRFNLRYTCTLKMTRYFTLVFACLCLLHSIVFGLFAEIQPLIGCVISNPVCLQYATYFYYPVLSGLLPITIACFFGILAYRNVRRIVRRQIPIVRRRLDRQMTAMVLMRVIIFVCLTSTYTIYRICTINSSVPRTQLLQYAIGRLLQAIFIFLVSQNYTMSFYVFVIASSRFRRQVKLVLVKRCWQRWTSCCCSRHNQVVPENRDSVGINIDPEENS